MEERVDTTPQGQKMSLELLTKEEIILKYKGLLTIAKKAKQAKDEILEENRVLREQLQEHETQKEADKKSLMTMKELLEAYTDNKLQLTTQVSELQKLHKADSEKLEKVSIENESLKRQLQRLTDDNESLLTDIENMEGQLKQVSSLSKEQREKLVLFERKIEELNAAEVNNNELKLKNDELCQQLKDFKEKYKFIKNINTEQRQKFNSLKDRFIELHKKLKKLKECKLILLETQHEYADAVTQWQNEIVKASHVLCKELNELREENIGLLRKLSKHQATKHIEKNCISMQKFNELLELSEKAEQEFKYLQEENAKLKRSLVNKSTKTPALLLESTVTKLDEIWHLSKVAFEEYNNIRKENMSLMEHAKLKDQVDSSTQSFEKYTTSSKLGELQALATKDSDDYEKQSNEIDNLKANIERLESENQNLETCKNKCGQLLEKINLLEEESVVEKLTPLEKEYLHHPEKMSVDMKKVTQEDTVLKDKVEELEKLNEESILNLKEELLSTQQSLEKYQQKYHHKKIEHCELLDEMRELNEALKARGDLISRQQEEHQILKNELKLNSDKLSKISQAIGEKDVELNEKQAEVETVKKEIAMTKQKLETLENAKSLNEEKVRVLSIELSNIKLNQSTTSTDVDNQSDILSTSTISRSDELQRLKDVDDSFEDKYNKIRGLAAKLKKKLQEETVLKQKLEKELQDTKKQQKELHSQIAELKNKILNTDSLHKQLNEKQKHIDNLKAENHKLKTSRKQANVLNLEIEAAEKSLTEVTNKLSNRTLELETAQESLKSKESTIVQLRKEIDLLESSKLSEVKHSQELKQQIDHLHKTLKDAMHSKQQAYDKAKLLEQDVENLKLELENANVELAQSTSNQEIALKSLNNDRELLIEQLSTTQAALLECEQKLKKSESAIEDLRVEYLDYKVKAQAVLRKNQNRDSSKERELEEELISMRASETRFNTTIDMLNLKIESLEKQKDLLNDDNMSLSKRCQELMMLIDDIRTQNDALNKEIQQNIQQQHETLKQHRQQIESIDNCHKEQIQSLNTAHQRQLEQLRKELSQHIRLPTSVGAAKSSSLPTQTYLDQSNEPSRLDFLLMEREDAEGSEEAAETLANLAASRKISNDSSSAKRSMQDFMPLDELLNTPLNAISSETLITNPQQQYTTDTALSAANANDLLQLELNTTKERLQKQETRVRHLTALLAENEQDLAKLAQMNDMLKEELRKQERSMEREQHMHNSEYVKNVIMKFLTLNNADEKSRLVPVLNTILKLSRSEAEMLNCVAKGQKVSENSQRTGGWGNFLAWGGNNSNNN